MAVHTNDFGMSYSLAIQKVIGEVKRATSKHDRAHDDAHTPVDWSTMLNQRAQILHALVTMETGPDFDREGYEKQLLAIASIATSALATSERAKR